MPHDNKRKATQAALVGSFWSLTEANDYARETARIVYERHAKLDEETGMPMKRWKEVKGGCVERDEVGAEMWKFEVAGG